MSRVDRAADPARGRRPVAAEAAGTEVPGAERAASAGRDDGANGLQPATTGWRGRGPALTMVGWIDDATGKVPSARFQLEHEDSVGYLRTLRHLVESKGPVLGIDGDAHQLRLVRRRRRRLPRAKHDRTSPG